MAAFCCAHLPLWRALGEVARRVAWRDHRDDASKLEGAGDPALRTGHTARKYEGRGERRRLDEQQVERQCALVQPLRPVAEQPRHLAAGGTAQAARAEVIHLIVLDACLVVVDWVRCDPIFLHLPVSDDAHLV